MKLIRLVLRPLSWIYGLILFCRNKLYDLNILKSYKPSIKTICIGNLALGGTGKTPHIEYLIRMLANNKVAVLSRGYGRVSKGTILATPKSTAEEIGDEPLQIANKFPKTPVIVEADRKKGIEFIQQKLPDTEVVLLDDALQHRKVESGLNILLTTYDLPYSKDHYLPSGRLRDHKIRSKDADFIVITKGPVSIQEGETKRFSSELKRSRESLGFSRFEMDSVHPVLNSKTQKSIENFNSIALVSGIAKPKQFEDSVSSKFNIVKHFIFTDHHRFTSSDMEDFHNFIGRFAPGKLAFLTTEKDAMRLRKPLREMQKEIPFFYQEISVVFEKGGDRFQDLIQSYVGNN